MYVHHKQTNVARSLRFDSAGDTGCSKPPRENAFVLIHLLRCPLAFQPFTSHPTGAQTCLLACTWKSPLHSTHAHGYAIRQERRCRARRAERRDVDEWPLYGLGWVTLSGWEKGRTGVRHWQGCGLAMQGTLGGCGCAGLSLFGPRATTTTVMSHMRVARRRRRRGSMYWKNWGGGDGWGGADGVCTHRTRLQI